MDDEKNVRLRIVHENEQQDDEISIDFVSIWRYLKRYLAIWLCLAVGLGSISGALALFARNPQVTGTAKALIATASVDYDTQKIKSPEVIEDALNAMGIDTLELEKVRDAITINGVIPESAYEKMSMYYGLTSDSSVALTAIESLFDTSYTISRYIVSFNYAKAGLNRADGVLFLNTLLDAYQDYCFSTYNSNAALQNPLEAIDYREYDYAEAVNVFSNTLDNISSYLSQFSNKRMGSSYRSATTGFTFSDLSKIASSLKEIDLDRAASYIVIHSVSENSADVQVSHYEWMIENLEQERAVQRTRLASLMDSINSYEKDSIIIFSGQNGASMAQNPDEINANYDAMIQEEMDTQSRIASYNRSISYYESVIEGFRQTDADASALDDIEIVKGYLEKLYQDLTELAKNVSLTANEYYETVSFADQIPVLVPATFDNEPPTMLIKAIIAMEAALFVAYFAVSFVHGVRDANPDAFNKKKAAEQAE